MVEEREHRLRKNSNVKIKDNGDTYPAVISNLSKNGMSLKTEHVCATYKVIDIIVKIGPKMVYLQGSVRWINESTPTSQDKLNEIGVALHNPPHEYVKHFGKD
ncbi:MAG: PilZ domain-containing protein [bacterium]|nr:PilZ domain-containing protein [bacterium]